MSLARVVALLALTVCPREARADALTKEECVAANENGSSLRHQQKLRDAKAEFLRCNSTTCPGPIRDDCALQIKELEMTTPTIRFRVRGPRGEEIPGVGVTIDGNNLTTWRDEMPIPLDPGDHVVSFSADGYKTIVRTIQLQLRTKREVESIVLEQTRAAPSAQVSPQASSSDV